MVESTAQIEAFVDSMARHFPHAPTDGQGRLIHALARFHCSTQPRCAIMIRGYAGTGKTKLLTDRVLRLLLSGSPADSILCVTYTRTAAAEMRNRIYRRLASWATMSADKLGAELTQMGLPLPSQEVRQRARILFAEILDNDDGPRVETVHSFCQSILRRFRLRPGYHRMLRWPMMTSRQD